jgi:hypothetical protein
MLETNRTAAFDDLRYQAMLYAAGEMEPRAAEAFENKLGTDADAQRALVQAVQMAGLLSGRSHTPDPAYRDAVRASVFAGKKRSRRRSRALWLTGSCAAALALIAVGFRGPGYTPPSAEVALAPAVPIEPAPATLPDVAPAVPLVQAPRVADPEENRDAADAEDALGAAEAWAELTNYERLRKVLEYELRRKLRLRMQPTKTSSSAI